MPDGHSTSDRQIRWERDLPGVTALPAMIEGDWVTQRDISASGERVDAWRPGDLVPFPSHVWHGVVRAPEPIVAVTFLVQQHRVRWAQSPHGDELDNHSEAMATRLGIKITLDPSAPYQAELRRVIDLSFVISWYGLRSRITLPSADKLPILPERREIQTGQLRMLAHIPGQPDTVIGLLFLARQDVFYGRNRIWHLRRDRAGTLDEAFTSVLRYRRSGHMAREAFVGGNPISWSTRFRSWFPRAFHAVSASLPTRLGMG